MPDVNAWAVIVPSVVTPSVVAGYALFQERFKTRQADRSELRIVLDDCAQELATCISYCAQTFNSWTGGTSSSSAGSEQLYEDAGGAIFGLRVKTARIALRIGTDAATTTAFVEVATELVGLWEWLHDYWSDVPAPDEEEFLERAKEVARLQRRYLVEAQALVGLKSPGPPSPLWPSLPLPPDNS